MSRPIVEYENGWPFMVLLGKKESALVQSTLGDGETIIGAVIGNFGQSAIATELRVLIVKTGLMAGQTFGGKVTSFDYRNIIGIEVKTGLSQGEFELLSSGLANIQGNRNRNKVKMAEAPNGLVFGKVDLKAFQDMATKMREMTAKAHNGNSAGSSESITDSIKKLSDLKDAGILTSEEFETKKAELLKRL